MYKIKVNGQEVDTSTPEGFMVWLRSQATDKYNDKRYMLGSWWRWENDGTHVESRYLEHKYSRTYIPEDVFQALSQVWSKGGYDGKCFVGARGTKSILQTVLGVPGYNEINDRLSAQEDATKRTKEINAYANAMNYLMGELQRLTIVYGDYIDTPAEQQKAVAVMNQLKNQALVKLPKES